MRVWLPKEQRRKKLSRAEYAWLLLFWFSGVSTVRLVATGSALGFVTAVVFGASAVCVMKAAMRAECTCGHVYGEHNERGCCTWGCECAGFTDR